MSQDINNRSFDLVLTEFSGFGTTMVNCYKYVWLYPFQTPNKADQLIDSVSHRATAISHLKYQLYSLCDDDKLIGCSWFHISMLMKLVQYDFSPDEGKCPIRAWMCTNPCNKYSIHKFQEHYIIVVSMAPNRNCQVAISNVNLNIFFVCLQNKRLFTIWCWSHVTDMTFALTYSVTLTTMYIKDQLTAWH